MSGSGVENVESYQQQEPGNRTAGNTDGSFSEDSAGESSDPASNILWNEVGKPWPATFERSMALLASPLISKEDVALYTQSPKPGNTPFAQRRARRAHMTPEPHLLVRPGARVTDGDFTKGVMKANSLDFASRNKYVPDELKPLTATLEKSQQTLLQQKDAAKEYRKKFLDEQQKKQDVEKGKQKSDAAAVESGKATFSQCVFNMSNILMGVGLLELPYALKESGWVGGLMSLLVLGIVTWRTSVLIGRTLNGDPRPLSSFKDDPVIKTPLAPGNLRNAGGRFRYPMKSFPDIARAAFGEVGCLILSLTLYFELFTCVCIFLITVGDHLHSLLPNISVARHLIIAGSVSMIPTIFLHNARLLSYFSMFGTLATFAVVVAVVFSAIAEGDMTSQIVDISDDEPAHIIYKRSGIPLTMGLVAYCFSGHAIAPNIYTSMKNPVEYENMMTLTYLIVVGCCLLVGASGYLMFGSGVLDQVTLSLEKYSSAILLMKILSMLIVLTGFSKVTLSVFPLSLGVEELIAPYLSSDLSSNIVSQTIKLIITVASVFVAICVPSFSYLCALVGLICTMTVSVIFPAAAHYKLFGPKLSFFEKFMDVVMVIFGIFVAIVGTKASI